MRTFICLSIAILVAGCPIPEATMPCTTDSHCNLAAGGQCVSAGDRSWCAYPSANCAGGMAYSSIDVGDGLAGQCVAVEPDASVDGASSDAAADATIADTAIADAAAPDSPIDATSPPCVQGIVFLSRRDGRLDIWNMNTDGSFPKNITRLTGGQIITAIPSPRGDKLAAVVYGVDDDEDLIVMNTDGSSPVNVSDGTSDIISLAESPDWAPDGTRIAYECYRRTADRTDREICTVRSDGTEHRIRTTSDGGDHEAKWSPDGSRIAFISERNFQNRYFGGEIYVMNSDGTNQIRLTYSPGPPAPAEVNDVLAWSPDGTKISFTKSVANSSSDLWIMNADGTGQRNLTQSPSRQESKGVWSPDGTKIAIAASVGSNYEIYVVSTTGQSSPVNVTNDPSNDEHPMWSPDGSHILFSSSRSNTQEIWRMRADGATPMKLTQGGGIEPQILPCPRRNP